MMNAIEHIDRQVKAIDIRIERLKDKRRALRLSRKQLLAEARAANRWVPEEKYERPEIRFRRWGTRRVLLHLGGYQVAKSTLGNKEERGAALDELQALGLVTPPPRALTEAGKALAARFEADPRRQNQLAVWTPEYKAERSRFLKAERAAEQQTRLRLKRQYRLDNLMSNAHVEAYQKNWDTCLWPRQMQNYPPTPPERNTVQYWRQVLKGRQQ